MAVSTMHQQGPDMAVLTHAPAGSVEWLTERRKGLGASEVPAVLGLSKFTSPHRLWLEKTGQVPVDPTGSPQALVGQFLEEPIAQLFARKYPAYELVKLDPVRHPRIPFLFASADRGALGGPADVAPQLLALVECKNRGGFPKGWGEAGTGDVPEDIFVQCMMQHAAYEVEQVYTAALLQGNDFRDYPLVFVPGSAEELERILTEWWDYHVVQGHEPPITGRGASDYLAKKFAFHSDDFITDATEQTRALAESRILLADQKKQAEEALEDVEAQLKAIIGEAAGLIVPEFAKVSWKKSKDSTATEWAKVVKAARERLVPEAAAELEELIAQYTTVKPGSRRFLFTAL